MSGSKEGIWWSPGTSGGRRRARTRHHGSPWIAGTPPSSWARQRDPPHRDGAHRATRSRPSGPAVQRAPRRPRGLRARHPPTAFPRRSRRAPKPSPGAVLHSGRTGAGGRTSSDNALDIRYSMARPVLVSRLLVLFLLSFLAYFPYGLLSVPGAFYGNWNMEFPNPWNGFFRSVSRAGPRARKAPAAAAPCCAAPGPGRAAPGSRRRPGGAGSPSPRRPRCRGS